MPRLITRDGLRMVMAQLDGLVNDPVELLLVGGAAVLVHSPDGVATRDLDALPTESLQTLLTALASHPEVAATVDLNTASAGFETYLPEDWEDRIERSEDFSTAHISVFTPSSEDLAVMKLFRYVAKDAEDIARLAATELFNAASFKTLFLTVLTTAIGQPRLHAQSFSLVWNELYPDNPVDIDELLKAAGVC